jgi:hypothetical protein
VGALSELAQLLLLLADAAAPAQVGHHQQESSRHGSSTGGGQQQLGSSQQVGCSSSSVLGLAWVQDAVAAAMQGLTQSGGSLRRSGGKCCMQEEGFSVPLAYLCTQTRHMLPTFAVFCVAVPCRAASQALAAALVLQQDTACQSQPQMLHADLAGVDHPT